MAKKSATLEAQASKEEAKAAAFEEFMKDQGKRAPGEVLLLSDDSIGTHVPSVSTGAISLDVALGCGGFPYGRVIELFGPEMSGKTSLALSVASGVQKKGGIVGFVDAEHALNRQHAIDMGVQPDRMVISQPGSGEIAIQMVLDMVKSGAFDMIIVDSIAAMTPQSEIDGDIDSERPGVQAKMISRFMRLAVGPCMEHGVMLVLINQLRTSFNSYGNPDVTPGGRAIKFYASVRVEIRSANSKKIERNKVVVGQTCVATVRKNKVGPPHRVAEYDLVFGKGIEGSGSLLDVAEALGVVTRAGAHYTEVATSEKLGMGKENVKVRLEDDAELTERLTTAVYAVLAGESSGEVSDDDADGEGITADEFEDGALGIA